MRLDPGLGGAHYKLGEVLQGLGRFADAADAYRRALAIDPGQAEARNNLGSALISLGRLAEAAAEFRRAIEAAPERAAVHANLGHALHGLGRLDDAASAFEAAVALAPDDAGAHNGAGMVLTTMGRLDEAAAAYRRAVAVRPDFAAAHYNLAGVLQKQGRTEDAADAYRKVLAFEPADPTARHMLAALAGETTEAAPSAYVAELFDDFAPRFESHLVAALEYRIPELMRGTLEPLLAARGVPRTPPFGRALDLGCGSGLVRPLFRDLVGELHGVDVSPRMAAQARGKGAYDFVRVDEMVRFLERAEADYDLVLAADVFVYVGNLEPVFAAVGRRLAGGGLFAFSVEGLASGTYALRRSGRYAHAERYVRRLAAAHGFAVSSCQAVVVRTENERPIDGFLFWLEMAA